MINRTNYGFTLVEIIIGLIILAIITAIAIPVTLSIIDNSRESDAKIIAKDIMTAVQSEFNSLAASREQWTSDSGKKGIILDENRKDFGKGNFKDQNEFNNGFIYVGNTSPIKNILDKLDENDSLEILYVAAGNVWKYYSSDDRDKMYKAYVVIFKMSGKDEPVWFFDGKNVSKEWPFSNYINKGKVSTGQSGDAFTLSNDKNTTLQIYALKIPQKNSKGAYEYWNNTLVKAVNEQNS